MPQNILRILSTVFALAAPLGASAQGGSIVGRVTEAGSGRPIQEVRVMATLGGQRVSEARTDESGNYRVANLAPNTYTLLVSRPGYEPQEIPGIAIAAGATARHDVQMRVVPRLIAEVVTTAQPGVGHERILDAPASVSVKSTQEVEERPSLTVADHIRGQPGVDVSSGGLVQAQIVARGFNNAFTGAMLVLQDNRFASVPSLRANIPVLFPSVNEDIERIEVLLGPAAALYGPNSASGVMHVITKSPFNSEGGTITVDGGERSVIRAAGRYAAASERVGFKVSGEVMRGRDWQYDDPAEPDSVLRATGAIVNGVAVREWVRNVRDFDIRKSAGELRLDVRPRPGVEWINTAGMTHVGSYIEITTSQGAAQAKNWTYGTYQSRLIWGRTFAQVFLNTSDAGNRDSLDTEGTFLLRTGTPIVDKSRVWSAQAQHYFDIGERQRFVLGGDYIFTNPRTGGTINGRNEDIDDVTEVGGYVHSVTRLSPLFEFVAALRYDSHSEMDDNFLSPRAALVFKPTQEQSLRLTYNRAFSTPANFSFFLDLPAGTLRPTVPYDVRGLGVPRGGFTFGRDCTGGAGGLCMRSPFPVVGPNLTPTAAPNTLMGANAAEFYRTIIAGNQTAFATALANAGVSQQNIPAVIGALLGANPSGIGTLLRLFNPSGVGTPEGPFATIVTPDQVTDVEPLKAGFNNVLEIGYKGFLARRLSLSTDLWYQRRENFITPSLNITPNVFMSPGAATAPGSLANVVATVLTQQAQQGRVPAAAVGPLTTAFVTTMASVPLGTVLPDHQLTDRPDIIFTYRNVDRAINLWGTDVAADVLLTDHFSVMGTYSFINKHTFPEIASGVDTLRLNAPQHKASVATRYRDEVRGWSAELRGRYMDAFPVNSGVYVGRVPVNAFLDASISWRPPLIGRGALVTVAGTNILDNRRRSFIGVPEIGRLVMTRVQYTF